MYDNVIYVLTYVYVYDNVIYVLTLCMYSVYDINNVKDVNIVFYARYLPLNFTIFNP